jgi:hypothetical protein
MVIPDEIIQFTKPVAVLFIVVYILFNLIINSMLLSGKAEPGHTPTNTAGVVINVIFIIMLLTVIKINIKSFN